MYMTQLDGKYLIRLYGALSADRVYTGSLNLAFFWMEAEQTKVFMKKFQITPKSQGH